MSAEKAYAFAVEIDLTVTPTETQKTELMVAVSNAIKQILGEPKGGTILISSPRE